MAKKVTVDDFIRGLVAIETLQPRYQISGVGSELMWTGYHRSKTPGGIQPEELAEIKTAIENAENY